MIKSMHIHPVFRVTHGLCAKYLLKKKKYFFKNQNESGKFKPGCSQVEAPGGQFFKCSTGLAQLLRVDFEERVQVLSVAA